MPYGMGPAGWGNRLLGTVEDGVGIPGGMGHPFLHGGIQRRKKRFGFSNRKPISFENN